jgi:hypothetical protein
MAIEIRAGLRKPYPSFVNEAKQGLKETGTVQLHGLGDSITNVIRAGEMLTSQGYANLVSFHTDTLTETRDGRTQNKAKAIITLIKADTFDKAFQDFENLSQARRINNT